MLERMFLRRDLLPFVWLGMGEEEGEAGLTYGILFVFVTLDEFLVPAGEVSGLVLVMIPLWG